MTILFLALDFMVGVADQSYAQGATIQAREALAGARRRSASVVYTKVGFRPGHPEIARRNRVFGRLLGTDRLVGAGSALVGAVIPDPGEPVLDKKRFSAFAGSGLWTVVRAREPSAVVMCGLSTSGVVLSTALDLIDADYDLTILSDACADPEPLVHATIMKSILAPRTRVCTVSEWLADDPEARDNPTAGGRT